jgi:hypothetical protein
MAEFEGTFLAELYELGMIRAVSFTLTEATTYFALLDSSVPIPPSTMKKGAERTELFCEAFLLGSKAYRKGPENIKITLKDTNLIWLYVPLMKYLKKEDFEEHEKDVRNIKSMVERLKRGERISHEEKKYAIDVLRKLYTLFEEKTLEKRMVLESYDSWYY